MRKQKTKKREYQETLLSPSIPSVLKTPGFYFFGTMSMPPVSALVAAMA